ncbi:MAG: thiamine pyrophosphate-dependent dehydrogenase E1 component subunit alpha [Candidatus Omnitrophica bacterium]|nr:thiamine pyrophosphate-dependent dehydrogenase E1 component subunit alpha [Candidatus Omnitrophota bacterium]
MRLSKEKLFKLLISLARIRKTQLKIEKHYHEDQMKTPVHLCLGEEAVSVGVSAHLKTSDMIFSNHRGHGHYLAKGGDLKALFAELFCKETGCAKGRGGSMHLIDTSVGHYGSSAIVAGSIPHAVGAAMAFVMQKKKNVAVSFFGDAASEEGVLQESMNWAKLHNLPVIFVCENNKYSVCSPIQVRQAEMPIATRALGFDIPAKTVDGMDIFKVYAAAEAAVTHARRGKGPYFLEFNVQRWRAHAGAGDPQAKLYRNPEDILDEKTMRDPLASLEKYLIKQKISSREKLDAIYQKIDEEVEEAFKFGQDSPLPKNEELEKYLFAK